MRKNDRIRSTKPVRWGTSRRLRTFITTAGFAGAAAIIGACGGSPRVSQADETSASGAVYASDAFPSPEERMNDPDSVSGTLGSTPDRETVAVEFHGSEQSEDEESFAPTNIADSEFYGAVDSVEQDRSGIWGGRENVAPMPPIIIAPPGTTVVGDAVEAIVADCVGVESSHQETYVFYVDANTLDVVNGVVQLAPGTDLAIATVDTLSHSTSCRASIEGVEMHVPSVGRGGLIVVRGMPTGTIDDPSDAMSDPGVEVVTILGWELVNGAWARTDVPVVLQAGSIPVAIACASTGLNTAFDGFVDGWLNEQVGYGTDIVPPEVPLDLQFRADAAWNAWQSADLAAARDLVAELVGTCDEDAAAMFVSTVIRAQAGDTPPREHANLMHPGAATSHAVLLHLAGEYPDARALLDQVLESFPEYAYAHLVSGRFLREFSLSPAIAEERLLQAASHPSTSRAAHYELGLYYESVGDSDSARTHYERASERDDFPQPVNALGYLDFATGDTEGARAHFLSAIDIDVTFAAAYNNLGFMAEQVDRDVESALDYYETAIQHDPAAASYRYNLGLLHEQWTGDLAAARVSYETALLCDAGFAQAEAAIEALSARPEASLDRLAGIWDATIQRPDGTVKQVVLTVYDDGNVTVVERIGEDAAAFDEVWRVSDTRGCQLDIWRDLDEPSSAQHVVEFVTNDEMLLFPTADPAARIRFRRRIGSDFATCGQPARL